MVYLFFSALSMVFRCKTLFNSNDKPFHLKKKKKKGGYFGILINKKKNFVKFIHVSV